MYICLQIYESPLKIPCKDCAEPRTDLKISLAFMNRVVWFPKWPINVEFEDLLYLS